MLTICAVLSIISHLLFVFKQPRDLASASLANSAQQYSVFDFLDIIINNCSDAAPSAEHILKDFALMNLLDCIPFFYRLEIRNSSHSFRPFPENQIIRIGIFFANRLSAWREIFPRVCQCSACFASIRTSSSPKRWIKRCSMRSLPPTAETQKMP